MHHDRTSLAEVLSTCRPQHSFDGEQLLISNSSLYEYYHEINTKGPLTQPNRAFLYLTIASHKRLVL